jgi:hypothetical protein
MVLALDALRRRHLDVRFRTRRGARAHVVERPGEWMSPADQESLVDDLRRVVRAGVGDAGLDYGVFASSEVLKRAVITVIYAEGTGRPVAFNVLQVLECELHGRPEEVLHLGLVMIDPEYRQSGLTGALYGITCFLISARRQMRPFWISNVTQVPLVFGIVGEFVEDVFPRARPGARRSFAHLQLARQLVARHRAAFGVGPEAEFDEDRFILRNSYTGGSDNLRKTFAEATPYRDEVVNTICREQLDYARGDDFVQLGRFTFSVARRYLTRSAALISPLALLTHGAMLLGESFVAPALQWLTPGVAMGAVRPAHEPGQSP